MQRATFTLTLTGTQREREQAADSLANILTEAGFFFDDDWAFHEAGWANGRPLRAGLVLHTEGAIRTALDALPRVGAQLIETNPEAV